MHHTSVLILIAATLLMALSTNIAIGETQPSGITVSGTGEVQGQPDVASITFGVQTEDKEAAAAAQANAAATSAVINSIMKFGIPKKDIETTQYSIQPIYDYVNNKSVKRGYSVTNQVRVKARDLTKVGALIDTATNAGANNVQGINFSIEDTNSLRREALLKAIKNAESDAQLIAETTGVKLGKPISVTTSGPIIPRPMAFGAMKAEAASTPIIPGDVDVSATVTIVYSIM